MNKRRRRLKRYRASYREFLEQNAWAEKLLATMDDVHRSMRTMCAAVEKFALEGEVLRRRREIDERWR